MNPKRILIGDIRICNKYEIKEECVDGKVVKKVIKETELYKKDAVLILIEKVGLVDLDNLNGITDYMDMVSHKLKEGWRGNVIMDIKPHFEGALYVDKASLKYYFADVYLERVSIQQLKTERSR